LIKHGGGDRICTTIPINLFLIQFWFKILRKRSKHIEKLINNLYKKKTTQKLEFNLKQKLFSSLDIVFKTILKWKNI
jgi:hypothetical protein